MSSAGSPGHVVRLRSGRSVTRRQVLGSAAAGGAAWLMSAPWVRRAAGAEELTVGLARHWVPGADGEARKVIEESCAMLGLKARVDFTTTLGRRNHERNEQEYKERRGHDIIDLPDQGPYRRRLLLEPLDDVMADLMRRHGQPLRWAAHVARVEGTWRAVPSPLFNQLYPQASRLDYWERFAGVDLRALFPAGPRNPAAVADWTWEAYLAGARRLHAAGHPVGNPIGPVSDANDWLRPLFLSFGGVPADAQGNITIDSDGTRHALEFLTRMVEVMPAEVFEWDDLGNNRHLISGRGSAIFNPPSAWDVARTRRPEAAQHMWHHDVPAGPAGRFRGSIPRSLGIWSFSPRKAEAKALLVALWEPDAQARLIAASQGYDMPPFARYHDHPVWRTAAPPQGTLYNYIVRGDEQVITAGHPAPSPMAIGIDSGYLLPNLVTRVVRGGQPVNDAIAWAVRELESFRP